MPHFLDDDMTRRDVRRRIRLLLDHQLKNKLHKIRKMNKEDLSSSTDEGDTQSHKEQSYDSDQESIEEDVRQKRSKKIHKLTLTETENFNEKLRKRGVVYVARIPPRMTPTKIKSLLSEFGEVTRVYLVEEDPTVRKRRKKEHGSSGGKRYLEGWVEFASKRKAKHIAQSLNNTQISNHKRNPHYGTKIFCKI